jgi:hypothetical protein
MSSNFFQATFVPYIPVKYVTMEDLEHLSQYGIDWEYMVKEEAYYFFVTDGWDEDECVYRFQEILRRIPEEEIGCIAMDAAYTCSKMLPGEFGGVGMVIYRDDLKATNTGEWVYEMTRKEKGHGG